ncbi:MAG: oxygen-independent coproporphyrinogen III oxidase [Rhodobacteraceae bacterium]|jgi:oxygen-independent coproporphyrinogen-3 oxidase|uniref:Coproporphyrinogen-III oxidase n=1 Tax=Salipiger profundus TaxID=1229727 RepID=A0A1U7D2K7_9RHOB|nr:MULTISPECIES: oxygen-independent coproporphyrinogen III oxidase [Salipiger]APX22397.1 oxygen-independent coproporphyrinogen-3 oxidase [Salipiger profundus]MAB05680.1 oxygen-independent coproporphyrinogen III oxidase [Paracoccaceae bacterium]GGA22954.1 coproporphyrinogen III oxidase, anaerobic 1 [Salipiger profundus]SFD64957.1 oxygen-independent coproporphyrinogen-3 oxidase [Salipiger profundus]
MKQIDRLTSLGLFNARVPRYTSYPTAPVFSTDVGATQQAQSLAALDASEPVSVYLHIPFCERLCWFCACRTQGTKTLSPVESYIGTLERELAILKDTLPDGLRMGRMHWGGGTPTILPPHLIHRLAQAVRAVIPPTETHEFSVEIDPTMVDRDKIAALAQEGMNRASIGIQDFDPKVQDAIGRMQPFDVTKACVDDLRAAGITSLNADLVYGLPHQDIARLDDTVSKVLDLSPDRVALFGYAHVPWVSKRQKLIDETALPQEVERYELASHAASRFTGAGFTAIGIDHFARSADGLARAAATGHLRRNFQGYTDDTCPTLIGIGASSISRLPTGYVQNAPATAAYVQRIEAGELAGSRGHVMTREDLLRARAIEMIMCDFRMDRSALRAAFGDTSRSLDLLIAQVAAQFGDFVDVTEEALEIRPSGQPLTRIIASAFDAYTQDAVRYSQAS